VVKNVLSVSRPELALLLNSGTRTEKENPDSSPQLLLFTLIIVAGSTEKNCGVQSVSEKPIFNFRILLD
jgi:hypothetical protein